MPPSIDSLLGSLIRSQCKEEVIGQPHGVGLGIEKPRARQLASNWQFVLATIVGDALVPSSFLLLHVTTIVMPLAAGNCQSAKNICSCSGTPQSQNM